MSTIINDVSQINPTKVLAISSPQNIEELQRIVKETNLPISIGGGKFSMGGQTSSPNSLHIDLRQLNKILFLDPIEKTIKVQAGTRWCDIQQFIDPHNLSVKIMQTYANFTVGGALSVNCHGRYMGLGPVLLSVLEVKLVLLSGELVTASPTQNTELFYGAIGGYGALGIIAEVTLSLASNSHVKRIDQKLKTKDYFEYFKQNIRNNPKIVFHNCDLYPSKYENCRSVSWVETDEQVTQPHRLMKEQDYPINRYIMWAISETPWGKRRRELVFDPLIYLQKPVHYRNYEAGYDVKELEPKAREQSTYVLQEYFIPVENFNLFAQKMRKILCRYDVNAINISIRHALADDKTYLNWAPKETFAFVLYYKQKTKEMHKDVVGIWTRELIDAAISCNGTYYLPYQPHATIEQFNQGYPKAIELFKLKEKYDPQYKLQNALWNKYYKDYLNTNKIQPVASKELNVVSEPPVLTRKDLSVEKFGGFNLHSYNFQEIINDAQFRDKLFLFLQNIFHLYPEEKLFDLIKQGVQKYKTDEEIYRFGQLHLPTVKPFLSELTYGIPALKKQKQEMLNQTLKLLKYAPKYQSKDQLDINSNEVHKKPFYGESNLLFENYLEIGSNGRYASTLKDYLGFKKMHFIHENLPNYSPPDILDRSQIWTLGKTALLNNYNPVDQIGLGISSKNKIDLLSCYVGLHHIPLDKMDVFLKSMVDCITPGGMFILRDHDVKSQKMFELVRLAHLVFNMGLNTPWCVAREELHYFRTVQDWIDILDKYGLKWTGEKLAQENDPTDNMLMVFKKI